MAENTTIYTPTDILNIVKEHLRTVNSLVVIEGVYHMTGTKAYNSGVWWYDEIKSQYDNSKLKAMVPTGIREQIKQGDIVQLVGTVTKSVNDYDGKIELMLRVSGLLGKKENSITEDDIKRLELLQKKAMKGSKSVDTLLESILYSEERKPKVAMLFAESSITDKDFFSGVKEASGYIDFEEFRESFGNISSFSTQLKNIDEKSYDAICIVRGGGSGLEVFDNIQMASQLMEVKTPTITAIGHEPDNPLLCKLSDRNFGTPSHLGHYFRDLVEAVTEKKTKSRTVLTEKIKKQFQEQLEASQKQNKELQERLGTITKTNEDAQNKQAEAIENMKKQAEEQLKASKQQNEELQKKLEDITKANEESQRKQAEVIETLNKQSEEQLKASKQQNEELQKKLENISKANEDVQKRQTEAIQKLQTNLTAQTKLANDFSNKLTKMQSTNQRLQKANTRILLGAVIIIVVLLIVIIA